MAVEDQMRRWELPVTHIVLGEVSTNAPIDDRLRETIKADLDKLGFELIDDKRKQVVERVKTAIIELIYQQDFDQRENLSTWLQEKVKQDYHQLSIWFSELESTTIEKYFIAQKIERVKELLHYEELTLTEIADQLHYSSVAYLSNQFKKVTGYTPSAYKSSADKRRQPLDKVKSYKK
ncbi:helix-turn-helix domain-containing protein [Sphingobacterium corticis]|uniref:Helix-turn-helix domain-containing protein n=1 Tax=Sphingobacterium corticis TaxID=1812823 RepID=A0ABW5NL31_9SPHI